METLNAVANATAQGWDADFARAGASTPRFAPRQHRQLERFRTPAFHFAAFYRSGPCQRRRRVCCSMYSSASFRGAIANQPSTIASRSGRLVTAFIWINTAG